MLLLLFLAHSLLACTCPNNQSHEARDFFASVFNVEPSLARHFCASDFCVEASVRSELLREDNKAFYHFRSLRHFRFTVGALEALQSDLLFTPTDNCQVELSRGIYYLCGKAREGRVVVRACDFHKRLESVGFGERLFFWSSSKRLSCREEEAAREAVVVKTTTERERERPIWMEGPTRANEFEYFEYEESDDVTRPLFTQ